MALPTSPNSVEPHTALLAVTIQDRKPRIDPVSVFLGILFGGISTTVVLIAILISQGSVPNVQPKEPAPGS